jgi:flavodoxin I
LNVTGIFYGSSSGKTEDVAFRIRQLIDEGKSGVWDIADSSARDLLDCRSLILGIPTWGIGELQEDWSDFLPGLGELDLGGKRVALFGLGDQESYPDSFANALGTLYNALLPTGCKIVGSFPLEGYRFMESTAVSKGRFRGLVLDEENQSHLTEGRLNRWLEEILPRLLS